MINDTEWICVDILVYIVFVRFMCGALYQYVSDDDDPIPPSRLGRDGVLARTNTRHRGHVDQSGGRLFESHYTF